VSSRPLEGRRVAVTRGISGEDALTERLVALGAEVLEAPSIAVAAPESFHDLDEALRGLGRVDWLVFASANAVERTVARADELGLQRAALSRPRLAVVGGSTARCAGRLLRSPDLVPTVATGAALAAALAPLVAGARVMVPRPAEGRPELLDGLAEAGAEVVAPIAYRTRPVAPAALEPLATALADGRVHAVLFASPSAVRSVLAALGSRRSLLQRVVLGAIGPTTAAELRSSGLAVDVQPSRSSGAALADALAERLGSPAS
jgi:uroporphyrinogen-III synthase/uroporphyrinogen III methyltransferase/synthase